MFALDPPSQFNYIKNKTLVLIFKMIYNLNNMVVSFRKSHTLGSRQSMYGNILVGLSFLSLTFLTVKTFAPDVKSNVETNTAEQTVGPYTASISVDSLTSINITPTPSQAVYTGTNTISYANTCPYGFNVTMTSASDNTSLTRLGEDSATKEIPSTTTTSLSDNTWGVSTNNGSTYSPIPSITATPVNIINTFEATNNPATLNLIYGVKTDSSLPSGSYTNDLIYTVSAKPQCLTYAITWNLDGGTAASGVTYPAVLNFGSTTNLSTLTPTKPGYIFTGWSNGTNTFNGTETAADINPGSLPSITMTAQWTRIMAENLEYTPPTGVTCTDAQCMIEYLDNMLN